MKLATLAAALAVSATAVLAAPTSYANGLEARAAAYKDGLRILCHSGDSSITCEGNRCTACCGECCECVIFPFKKKGSTKTLIEFSPDCSGKCSSFKKDRKKHKHHGAHRPDHSRRPDYSPHYESPHYHDAPKKDNWPFDGKSKGRFDYDDDDEDDEPRRGGFRHRETQHPGYPSGYRGYD